MPFVSPLLPVLFFTLFSIRCHLTVFYLPVSSRHISVPLLFMASSSPQLWDIPPIRGTNGRRLESKENSVEANLEYSRDVRGLQVGPVPIMLWNVVFMENVQVQQRPPQIDWSPVLKATTEADMYKPFVSPSDITSCSL